MGCCVQVGHWGPHATFATEGNRLIPNNGELVGLETGSTQESAEMAVPCAQPACMRHEEESREILL